MGGGRRILSRRSDSGGRRAAAPADRGAGSEAWCCGGYRSFGRRKAVWQSMVTSSGDAQDDILGGGGGREPLEVSESSGQTTCDEFDEESRIPARGTDV